ncbi:MAG: biotin--[acetyl-CoA-carboxylase] ligase [Desulfocapsaceae bacterium]|nr:biotin--[acetyl-CoA-carboxylase] ligase [Desulfocapsaceae bacterium]
MKDILLLETVDSTNRVARDLGTAGKPHGYAVVAGSQLHGRGRLGKAWQSPPGKGLYATILLRPCLEVKEYSKITLTAGLALSQVLEEVCQLDVALKWPNDIYISGRKCGGILVETSSLQGEADGHFALVGIGVNVNTEKEAFLPDLRKSATSLFLESGKEYEILSLFEAIRSRLLQLIFQLAHEGFTDILNKWRERDMLQGKWTQWLTPTGEVIYGESLGVDNNGILSVRDRSGKIHEVLSGDVSLTPQLGGREII